MKVSKKTVIFLSLGAVFLIIGVPIIINESYKLNRGYMTLWEASDVLEYYGTILGSIVAVVSIVITIIFTRKQIQRDSFLKSENDKWDRLKAVFLQILNDINPMYMEKAIIENETADPSKTVAVLQKYQMDCRIAQDKLLLQLNQDDYPRFKKIIDAIATLSDECSAICQKEVELYSSLSIYKHKDNILELEKMMENYPQFTNRDIQVNNRHFAEIVKTIDFEEIQKNIAIQNEQLVHIYEEKYRPLLRLTESTFDEVDLETQHRADAMLQFGKTHK